MSGREFAVSGGKHVESKMVYTIRRPITLTLNSGIVIKDGAEKLEVVEVVDNAVRRGFIDLRAQTTRMEGLGYV